MTLALAIVALVFAVAAVGLWVYGIRYLKSKVGPGFVLRKPDFEAHREECHKLAVAIKGMATKQWVSDYLSENYTHDEPLAETYVKKEELGNETLGYDFVTKQELKNALTTHAAPLEPTPSAVSPAIERKLERALTLQPEMVACLKVVYGMASAQATSTIKEEIAHLESVISRSRKGQKPLQEAVREAEKKLSELKKIKMAENPSEEELDREATVYVASLKLKTAKERTQASLDYFEMRPERYQAHMDELEAVKTELEEAKAALAAFTTESDVGDAETRLAELRAKLSTFENAEKALASLEQKVAEPAPRTSPPRSAARVSEPPQQVDENEVSLEILVKNASLTPPPPPADLTPPAPPAASPAPNWAKRTMAGPPPMPQGKPKS